VNRGSLPDAVGLLPRCELIIIGTEMTAGEREDSNSVWLRRELRRLAVRISRVTLVGDELPDLEAALAGALARADLILTTGGLGPTQDDRTLEAVSRACRLPRRLSEEIRRRLEDHAHAAGRRLSRRALEQARLPEGSRLLPNQRGTAPGVMLEVGNTLLAVLPGVPDEMEGIYRDHLESELKRRFGRFPLARACVRIGGRWESEVDDRVEGLCARAGVGRTVLASAGVVEVHLIGPAQATGQTVGEIRALFGEDVISTAGESLAEVILSEARRRNGCVAVAESCTGGRIAAALTAVPGASEVFRRGYVVYADEAKSDLLGVPPGTLAGHGAVSSETAIAMVRGLLERSGCRWGVAVTGIAGPGGGGPGKPVGTVWLATAGPAGTQTARRRVRGGRDRVQAVAAGAALDLLRRTILRETPA
jgi:nicotinamide-nucleotide amidase